MPIVYPGAFDSFGTPSAPESTSLSSAGDATRDHTELLHDLGLVAMALEQNAALKGHDHSGDATDIHKGSKLAQANTHQSADTDTAPGSIHHTLDTTTGINANKAAPANHVHDYTDTTRLTNTPYRICTSLTRPSSPFLGLTIFETDTNFIRIWSNVGGTTAWHVMRGLAVPLVRLQQTTVQNISQSGTLINFQSELEDTNNFFDATVSQTDIHINEPGLYHIEGSMQWNTTYCPDTSFVILTVNDANTTLREHRATRGESQQPGFSQTLAFSGYLRLQVGDVLRMKAAYQASGGLFGLIFTFIEFILSGGAPDQERISTRMELVYVGP